jgi:hypothetical protein
MSVLAEGLQELFAIFFDVWTGHCVSSYDSERLAERKLIRARCHLAI